MDLGCQKRSHCGLSAVSRTTFAHLGDGSGYWPVVAVLAGRNTGERGRNCESHQDGRLAIGTPCDRSPSSWPVGTGTLLGTVCFIVQILGETAWTQTA